MNPKQFLVLGGAVLVLVAVLGWIGVIGPTAEQSIFGATWYFDMAENVAHLVLGVVALAAAYVLPGNLQKWLVIAVGVLAILVALYNLTSSELLGAMLQNPMDLLLHAVVGVWALSAAFRKGHSMAMSS